MSKRRVRVGILFGGKSGEHEVSIASAQSVVDALDKNKYEPVLIGIDKQGRWLAGQAVARQLAGGQQKADSGLQIADGAENRTASDPLSAMSHQLLAISHQPSAQRNSPLAEIDVVFPVLHGPLGEDGSVQGLLEIADIPYVGAGVAASAVGMDKDLMKKLFAAAGLQCVPYVAVLRGEWERRPDDVIRRVEACLPYPVFVKPANLGSSVGISKARQADELREAMRLACAYDRKVLVEQGLNAREVECSVLGNDEPITSVVGEIRTVRREFYDYIAKYTDGEAELIIPADLPKVKSDEVRAIALRAYKAIDCNGMARVDFFIERETDKVYLNELNTIPGFTKYSMYPKLWEATGLSYAELIDRLIMLALERYADKKRSGL